MKIIGISAYYHDSAAALVCDGKIIAAAQEERFTRIKHDSEFPHQALRHCLKQANVALADIDQVVFYDKPFLKFERLLETYLAFAPKGFTSFCKAIPIWLKEKLFLKKTLMNELKQYGFNDHAKLLFSEHHFSHAASAFYPSPFEKAVVLTMDGVGEWATTSLAIGNSNKLEILKEIHFPHSLGLLYSAFTYFTGFKVNSGEYKVMGLAPYGTPKYKDLIFEHLIDVKEDGSFRLNMDYFDYCTGLTMTNKKFEKLFNRSPRHAEDKLTQDDMDLAASIQKVTEEIVVKLCNSLAKETGLKNICLAGGVALNCVANGLINQKKIFENIWIQPAAGDAGGALGAALAGYYHHNKLPRTVIEGDAMSGSYLGPEYSQKEIETQLNDIGAKYIVFNEGEIITKTAEKIAEGKAVGWFQGRMEFGPRALGNRSILGDPRSPTTQSVLNLKIKYRESFRPFAPSVLKEDTANWFELNSDSPYMLLVANVKDEKCIMMNLNQQSLFGIEKLNIVRSEIPAVTHIDYSARIQTVHQETNPRYHALISKFKEMTGCPVLVNTSFNVRGEPIVESPKDAFRCFMGTELDLLVVGNCFLEKVTQNPDLKLNYKDQFALD